MTGGCSYPVGRRALRVGAVAALCSALVVIVGAAWGAGIPGLVYVTPNTAGAGGHQRTIDFSTLAAPTASEPLSAVLSNANPKRESVVAKVGTGQQVAQLIAVEMGDGRTCFTASHATGKIVEPLNCGADAYIRLWSDAHGTGEPSTDNVESSRIIVLVATEVQRVRVTFDDGSTRTLAPNSSGAVALEAGATSPKPVLLDALAEDGSTLVSVIT